MNACTRKLFLTHILLLAAIVAPILACNFTPEGNSEDRNATVQALSTSVAATSTAISVEEEVVPTFTTIVQEVPTQVAAATPEPTQDLVATEAAGQLAATEAAIAPFKAELVKYGVDPENGQLAWVQGPLRFEIDQYRGSSFGNEIPQVIVQDFVLTADITWDTEYGAAGCAFVFRSDGNQAKPNQYMVWMTRLTDGRIEFTVFAEGEIVAIKDFYANGIDPSFNGGNGATNRLTVVGQGYQFTIYSNGEKVGIGDPNAPLPPLVLPEPPVGNPNDPSYQAALAEYRSVVSRLKNEYNRRAAIAKNANKNFPAGVVAMGALAESGYTMCEFNNAWLWLIGPSTTP